MGGGYTTGTWDEIKIEYMTSETALRALSRKYDVPLTSLCRRVKNEGWEEQRSAYWDAVVQKALDDHAAAQTNKLSSLSRAADNIAAVIDHEVEKFKASAMDGASCIKVQDLKDLSQAVKTLVSVIRDLNDLPGASDRERLEIEKRRLALEEKRIESDKKDDFAIEVVLGDSEEYAE